MYEDVLLLFLRCGGLRVKFEVRWITDCCLLCFVNMLLVDIIIQQYLVGCILSATCILILLVQ